jgi:ribonucleoside-diphosphate reductase alpha chain
LGYTKVQVDDIVKYIDIEKTIVGAPHLKDEHLPVFACSMGDNVIHYLGHVKMMAAVQPFISGAISKTVNMPESATVEDIEQLHIDAWKMGVKAVAIYRDNCKVAQPLSTAKKEGSESDETTQLDKQDQKDVYIVKGAVKRELPRKRNSKTYEFHVSDAKGFFTVGEYDDGKPGELFVNFSKQGSTLSGLLDSFAIAVSHGLQYGVPLKSYVKTLMNRSFAPSGITDDPEIRTATSITDYIFRRMAHDYLSFDDKLELGLVSIDDMPDDNQPVLIELPANEPIDDPETIESSKLGVEKSQTTKGKKPIKDITAPLCYSCGNQTQRSGSCYVCTACGSTTGCS